PGWELPASPAPEPGALPGAPAGPAPFADSASSAPSGSLAAIRHLHLAAPIPTPAIANRLCRHGRHHDILMSSWAPPRQTPELARRTIRLYDSDRFWESAGMIAFNLSVLDVPEDFGDAEPAPHVPCRGRQRVGARGGPGTGGHPGRGLRLARRPAE